MNRSQVRAHIEESFVVIVQKVTQLGERGFLYSNDLLAERRDCFGDRLTESLTNSVNQRVTGDIKGYCRSFFRGRRGLVTGCRSRFRGSWLFGRWRKRLGGFGGRLRRLLTFRARDHGF